MNRSIKNIYIDILIYSYGYKTVEKIKSCVYIYRYIGSEIGNHYWHTLKPYKDHENKY